MRVGLPGCAIARHVGAPLTPLRRLGGRRLSQLNPMVDVEGVDYVILFQELAAFPVKRFGPAVTSAGIARVELVAALDLPFTGS